jgi:hypothetical protein
MPTQYQELFENKDAEPHQSLENFSEKGHDIEINIRSSRSSQSTVNSVPSSELKFPGNRPLEPKEPISTDL